MKILDTRKTLPNLRDLQKYAVRLGGGHNHRMDLSEMLLVKDNHIAIVGDLTKIMNAAQKQKGKKIEVEVKSLEEVREVMNLKPEWIMLDNMDVPTAKKALEII